MQAAIVDRREWLERRRELLEKERALTHARDALSAARREMPWTPVEDYEFEAERGVVRLSELFAGRSQLVVYHFMYHPDWTAGCKSCSFWADNFERIVPHLRARDANLVAVSRAPLAKLEAFKARMGWTFEWVSCGAEGRFNHDLGAYITKDELAKPGANSNFGTGRFNIEDVPAISVFARDPSGALFHTYSTFTRGLDMLNGAYHYLDLLPKGRDEAGPHKMQWVRLRDEYPDAAVSPR